MEVIMSTGAIIGIIIVVIVVLAIGALASMQLRRARMRRQFGPEYDRLAGEIGPRKADAELAARQRRVDELGIHPLSAQQQANYSGDWAAVQERFVDAPAEAVGAADMLIWNVMQDRGYPTQDRKASMEALSVYHAHSLNGYRQAQDLRIDSATTEELREAMIGHRALFEDLTGLQEGPVQPGRHRTAAISDRAEDNQGVVEDRHLATQDPDLAAENDRAAEDADRTADTPR
jgi:hypothetical protein